MIFGLLTLESVSLHYLPKLAPLCLCITSTAIVFFCFYCTPWLVFSALQRENHFLKSMKESTYMQRLIVAELFSVILIPIIYDLLLVHYAPEGYRGKPNREHEMTQFDLETPKYEASVRAAAAVSLVNLAVNKNLVDTIAYTEEYLLRFVLQAILMVCLFQLCSSTRSILKAFLQSFAKGKSKFKHYLYDLGLRNVLAVTMLTAGLCCSVVIPLAMPLFAVLFWLAYVFDKYNLFYVYPIEFESRLMNR